jgi:hypothetical protein
VRGGERGGKRPVARFAKKTGFFADLAQVRRWASYLWRAIRSWLRALMAVSDDGNGRQDVGAGDLGMEASTQAGIFWLIVAVVVLGAVSTVVARGCLTSSSRCLGRLFFFLCLLLAGGGTVLAMLAGSPLWVAGGAVLALMSIGATWEPNRGREAAAW